MSSLITAAATASWLDGARPRTRNIAVGWCERIHAGIVVEHSSCGSHRTILSSLLGRQGPACCEPAPYSPSMFSEAVSITRLAVSASNRPRDVC